MMKISVPLLSLFILLSTPGPACAENEDAPCTYADTLKMVSCGNRPLSSIDTTTSGCLIAHYLQRYISYTLEHGASCSASVALMTKRYESFADPQVWRIDCSKVQWLGDSAAPVSVIMYVSMSCPHCKQVYKQLYDTLYANRSLMKHCRLGIKYRSDTKYDKVLAAAAIFGKQPAFMRRCADVTGRIGDNEVKRVAGMISIPFDTLQEAAYRKETILDVKTSKAEAIDNGVEFTPAIFVNGHKYLSTKSADWILDAVTYYEALAIPKK